MCRCQHEIAGGAMACQVCSDKAEIHDSFNRDGILDGVKLKMTKERRAEARENHKYFLESLSDDSGEAVCGYTGVDRAVFVYYGRGGLQDIPEALDDIDALEAENARLRKSIDVLAGKLRDKYKHNAT